MGLLSLFKRRADAASTAADSGASADAVQQARTRARQRLIGAVVLVVIGVIGFPLVFETQPRPVAVDTPIEIARKDGAPPLADTPMRAPTAAPAVTASPRDDVITESSSDAGREVAPKAAEPASATTRATPAKEAAVVKEAPAAAATAKPAPEPTRKAEPSAEPRSEAARAKALLDAGPAAGAQARFIVQVGAFAEAASARETRLKVEKLGLKTYTQVAQTAGGSRIRVRVGPFASREEADKAVAKARAAGITAVVLTL